MYIQYKYIDMQLYVAISPAVAKCVHTHILLLHTPEGPTEGTRQLEVVVP